MAGRLENLWSIVLVIGKHSPNHSYRGRGVGQEGANERLQRSSYKRVPRGSQAERA